MNGNKGSVVSFFQGAGPPLQDSGSKELRSLFEVADML